MARSENNLQAVFQDTANAIKTKKGSESPICPRDFGDEIANLPSGPSLSDGLYNVSNGEATNLVTRVCASNSNGVMVASGEYEEEIHPEIHDYLYSVNGNNVDRVYLQADISSEAHYLWGSKANGYKQGSLQVGHYYIAAFRENSILDEIPTPVTPSGTYNITANGTYDVTKYASVQVNVPQPSGNITLYHNIASYDISQYASAIVNIETFEGLNCDSSYFEAISDKIYNNHIVYSVRGSIGTNYHIVYGSSQYPGTGNSRTIWFSVSNDMSTAEREFCLLKVEDGVVYINPYFDEPNYIYKDNNDLTMFFAFLSNTTEFNIMPEFLVAIDASWYSGQGWTSEEIIDLVKANWYYGDFVFRDLLGNLVGTVPIDEVSFTVWGLESGSGSGSGSGE